MRAPLRCAGRRREEVPEVALDAEALAEADLLLLDGRGRAGAGAGDGGLAANRSKRRRASREPHRVAFYLHDLASAFHAHWNKGKELPQLRFIRPEDMRLEPRPARSRHRAWAWCSDPDCKFLVSRRPRKCIRVRGRASLNER